MRLIRLLVAALLFSFALGFATAQIAQAEQVAQTQPATSASAEPSLWNKAIAWVFIQQRHFHRQLTQRLRSLSEQGSGQAALGLIVASFLYGVFHAAGPGHGKAVLSTYLLTQRQRLSRGLKLAVAAAFCQGLVALIIVYGLIGLAGWLPRDTQSAVTWSERASFVLVSAIGIWLIARSVRAVIAAWRPVNVHHDHDHACGCGHSHAVTPSQAEKATDLRTAIGIVLSIGLRPCTGAIIVLVFANAFALQWAGVGAVLAMSAGTAITMVSLAFLAVHAREWAGRAAAKTGRRTVGLANAAMLAGGLAILWVGGSLLAASFGPAHPLGL